MRDNRIAGRLRSAIINVPDIEYNVLREKLDKVIDYRDLNDKNDIFKKDKKTFILSPGMMVNYENSQSDTDPYPQSDIPYSHGPTWSDYF